MIHIFCANNAIKQIVSYVPAKASGYFLKIFFFLKYDAMIQGGGNEGGRNLWQNLNYEEKVQNSLV